MLKVKNLDHMFAFGMHLLFFSRWMTDLPLGCLVHFADLIEDFARARSARSKVKII